MSITSGFFNSVDGDRKYNAEEMTAIFSGIINDGVFENIGEKFIVTASDVDSSVLVGTGRAWLDNAWIYNDSKYLVSLPAPEAIMKRYDAIILESDHDDSVRKGTIKVSPGIPSNEEPVKPTIVNTNHSKQMILAYIYRTPNVSTIVQADILNCVGTSDCPYITGVLKVNSIDELVAQWQAQYNTWMTKTQSEYSSFMQSMSYILNDKDAAKLTTDMLTLNNRLNMLATEHSVGDMVVDSNGNFVTDDSGSSILGGVKFITESEGIYTDLTGPFEIRSWRTSDDYAYAGYGYTARFRKEYLGTNVVNENSVVEAVLTPSEDSSVVAPFVKSNADGSISFYASDDPGVTIGVSRISIRKMSN